MFNNKPTSGWYCTIDPSLSSASIINQSPSPYAALPILPDLINRDKPAPPITDGLRPAWCNISNNMAVVVLFPDVPPTATVFLAVTISASNSLRLMIRFDKVFACCTSGTESSIAVETTTQSILSETAPAPCS